MAADRKKRRADAAPADDAERAASGNRDAGVRILQLVAGIIFFAFAAGLREFGLRFPVYVCMFLGTACALLLIANLCRNTRFKNAGRFTGVAILLSAMVFAYLAITSKPLTTPTATPDADAAFTHPDPDEIITVLNAVNPGMRQDISNGYLGAQVHWLLQLSSVERVPDASALLYMNEAPRSHTSALVVTKVPLKGNEYIYSVKPSDMLEVSGTIAGVDASTVTLNNVSISKHQQH